MPAEKFTCQSCLSNFIVVDSSAIPLDDLVFCPACRPAVKSPAKPRPLPGWKSNDDFADLPTPPPVPAQLPPRSSLSHQRGLIAADQGNIPSSPATFHEAWQQVWLPQNRTWTAGITVFLAVAVFAAIRIGFMPENPVQSHRYFDDVGKTNPYAASDAAAEAVQRSEEAFRKGRAEYLEQQERQELQDALDRNGSGLKLTPEQAARAIEIYTGQQRGR